MFQYVKQWIAEYGYEYWAVPFAAYPVYVLALTAAYFADASGRKSAPEIRRGLAIVFLVGCVATVLSLYVADTPVGSAEIHGVQGRYFAPYAPLALMALVGWSPVLDLSRTARLARVLSASSLFTYGAGLLLSYHVVCGTAYFQPGLCYQPEYKNWDPNARYSAPVSQTLSLTQEIVAECNGLREIRIWVDSTDASASGATEFSLYERDSLDPLVTGTVPNARLPQGGWYALQLGTEWQSSGKLYRLEIQAGPPFTGPGPRIALSLRPEYEPGQLYQNLSQLDTDLIFKYGCVAGLEKLMLDATTAAIG